MNLSRGLLRGAMLAALLGILGCHLIFSHKPGEVGRTYRCDATIKEFARTYPAPDPADQLAIHGVGPVEYLTFYNSEPGVLPNLYTNHPWKPTADGLPWQLKGTHLVRVSDANADFSGDPFLDVALHADVQELIVGFDTRATSPPLWLSQKFERMKDVVLRSTQKYTPQGSPGPPVNVEYSLWHPSAAHRSEFTRKFSLAGNGASGVVWAGGKVGSQYLVFLRPPPWIDKGKTQDRDAVQVEVCEQAGDSPDAARKAAEAGKGLVLDQWLAEPEHAMFASAHADGALDVVFDPAKPCAPTTDAPLHPKTYKACTSKSDELGSTEQPLASWLLRSRAAIDPSARITVRARGTTTSGAIRGRISFRITLENRVEIGELTVFTDPLNAGGLAVEEISFGQARALVADCTDTPPPGPSRLCQDYVIPVGEAATQVAGTLDGQPVFVPLRNSQPVDVHVDFNSRNFTMSTSGRPLVGELLVDGDRELVEILLDVTGVFENLAPVASVKEMPARFECLDAGQATVHLDAAASFDEDPGTGVVAYRWTEDAGLATQRLLGTSKMLDAKMNFGGHPITLVVTDDQGAIDSETVLIDVFDSKIDSDQIPPDVFAMRQDRSGAIVAIGDATASDGCSGAVAIANDAPPDLRFPPGASTVVWTFDDYHGNVVRHEQKVFVVEAVYYPPPIASSWTLQNLTTEGSPEIVYVYGTQDQGKRMRADEHVRVRTPSGRVFAVDGAGQLVDARGERAARGTGRSFGRTPTQGSVALRPFAGPLGEEGRYELSYVLTVPGGSPEEREDVLARDDAVLELRRQ